MWSLWRRALVDPAGFFADAEPSRRATALVLAATTVVCLLPGPLKIVALRSDAVDWDVIGTFPQFVYAVSDASIGVPGLYGLVVFTGLVFPTACVLLYAAIFHALSWPVAGGGSYRETVVVTAWGLVPLTVAGALSLAVLFPAFAVLGPIPVVTGINFPGRVVVSPLSRTSPWILLDLLVSGMLLWTGYVWTRGIAAVRGISTRRGAAVVALPLAWTLLGTIAVQILLVKTAAFLGTL